MFRIILFVAVAAGFAAEACAQYGSNSVLNQAYSNRSEFGNTLFRPTVSPYLQLTQNGATPVAGQGGIYQTQVRPQVQARDSARMQQQQIQNIQNDLNRVQQEFRRPTGGQMSTGHPTRFMSYLHYYPSLGR